MYAYHSEEHTAAQSTCNKGPVASCSSQEKTWIQHPCWQFYNLLFFFFFFSFFIAELLTLSTPPSPHMQAITNSQCTQSPHESFRFITYPTKPKKLAPVYADMSEHVTHGSWECNLHFDKMHFIFSSVISNRCLRVLISVPRSLLLLTWETDTFLNAYKLPRGVNMTVWPFPRSHRFSEFDYTKSISLFLFFFWLNIWRL